MGSPQFHAILDELRALHDQKDEEYSGDTPLSNYRTAEEWGDPAWKSSLLRAEEKRKRLQNQWKSGKELRRDDWLDLCAHWINTLVLWEEEVAPVVASVVDNPCDHARCYTKNSTRREHRCFGTHSNWRCPDCGFICQ